MDGARNGHGGQPAARQALFASGRGAYTRSVTVPKELLPAEPSALAPFRVGEWTVHPSLNRLTRGSETVQIEPRAMHALVCLAAHPGKVITRDTFLDHVWKGTIVVEKVLTNIISELRSVLGDDAASPRYIETIRKTGYRLVAPVLPPEVPAESWRPARTAGPRDGVGTASAGPSAGRRRRLSRSPLLLALPAALALVLASLSLLGRWDAPASPPLIAGRPFATDPSHELWPALSPDGSRVAYAWAGPEGENLDIYVKRIDSEETLRLTRDPLPEGYPAWSPDGERIAFVRGAGRSDLYLVAAGGGTEELVAQAPSEILGASWSPDGRSIAYSAAPSASERLQVQLIDLETRARRQVNETCPDYNCAFEPRFSPDGRSIAFLWADIAGLHDLYLIPVTGGEARRLTRLQARMFGFDWSRDGRDLVFATAPRGERSLWRLDLESGALSWLPTQSRRIWYPSIARDADRMVFEERTGHTQIWEVGLDTGGRPQPAHLLIGSTQLDTAPRVSPDGRRIAFVSLRRGVREIWICDRDGSGARPLLEVEGAVFGYPVWSPDGRSIAYSALRNEHIAVHTADCETGAARALVRGDHHELVGEWSADGSWLYCMLDSGSGWHTHRMHPDGRNAELLSEDGDGLLWVARDGSFLYQLGRRESGIWRVPIGGSGEPQQLVDAAAMSGWQTYECLEEGVYFTRRGHPGESILGYHEFSTGRTDSLGPLPAGTGLITVAPDGRALLVTAPTALGSDIVLVDALSMGRR